MINVSVLSSKVCVCVCVRLWAKKLAYLLCSLLYIQLLLLLLLFSLLLLLLLFRFYLLLTLWQRQRQVVSTLLLLLLLHTFHYTVSARLHEKETSKYMYRYVYR